MKLCPLNKKKSLSAYTEIVGAYADCIFEILIFDYKGVLKF